ncbi:glycosyl transferase, family 39 [Sulfurimonas gotlandica GD1]|uniref:Glycosyl transferase, family 39 n=1 Tax=Sulfurimonas gotlandica (strain DSM 19862 / JCM 16533 / GD1) TaxID=929558 RepID=B6BJT4_SULGG|nr:glycosyltransferase family 39 protein [Sulfurimonas gotlandica]EDZ62755.1 dolichyl-phosphate-mannose-protein mannosyltransferase [Sulfurimonas gotlandica GD1]EHP31334.1 glycosyl transferase, family 39 [Sulfurimonas gotlandica GD1]
MNLANKQHQNFLFFISFVAILRLTLAPFVGLGVDEAHYVLYALNLDLSYFDHPPLVGWVQYIFTSIFSTSEFGARVAAIIIGFVTSIFIYKLIYDINKNTNQAFIAVLALHASFLFNALFIMLMPDTLLFLLILPIIFTVIEIEKNDRLSTWLLLGLLLGLAGLSKYTAVLFIVPIILYVLLRRRYDLLYTQNIIPSIVLALIIILPVIVWNIQNDWSSFAYQSAHVVGSNSINWNGFASSIGAQFGAYNPFLTPLAFYGLYKALRSENSTIFLTALFGFVMILFFTYASLYKTALPHWSALFYMLFIPIGTFYMLQISKKYLKFAIGFGLLLSIIAYAELGFKFIPLPDHQSLHRDIYGWDEIMKRANEQITDANTEAIAVTNWTLASRAIYYNRNYDSAVYLVDDRDDQFDVWEKEKPLGKDLVIINTHSFEKNINKYMKCSEVIQYNKFDIMLNDSKVNTIQLIRCKNYQGLK